MYSDDSEHNPTTALRARRRLSATNPSLRRGRAAYPLTDR
jgi:hypothetical protein